MNFDVTEYWQDRYSGGGFSGLGSLGALGRYKAMVVGDFITEYRIKSINDFGCGDGTWLAVLHAYLGPYALEAYMGYDISEAARDACEFVFGAHDVYSFRSLEMCKHAELSLSNDVIYHLLNDREYERYMSRLFEYSSKYVIIYSSNFDEAPTERSPHIKHRIFTDWIKANAPDWKLIRHIPNLYRESKYNPSLSDHYIYEHCNLSTPI